jgi:hypothetical protein
MEATRSSETSVYDKPTQCHIPEGGILINYMLFGMDCVGLYGSLSGNRVQLIAIFLL